MYVVATRINTAMNGRPYNTSQLYEVSNKAELVELGGRYDNVRKVPASVAHKWVRDGGIHNTGLYIDEGRIRKARTCFAPSG